MWSKNLTYGCELEIANIPLKKNEKLINSIGFLLNDKEQTIVNNLENIFIPNDPTYKFYDIGGELNSIVFYHSNDLVDAIKKLFDNLNIKDIDMKGSYSNFHIHIGGLVDDYEFIKKFIYWMMNNNESILKDWSFLVGVGNRYEKESKTYHYTNLWNRIKDTNSLEEFSYAYCLKDPQRARVDSKYLSMSKSYYKRPWVNFQQLLITKTIEFRMFHIEPSYQEDILIYIKLLQYMIEKVMNDEPYSTPPFYKDLKNKEYSIVEGMYSKNLQFFSSHSSFSKKLGESILEYCKTLNLSIELKERLGINKKEEINE